MNPWKAQPPLLLLEAQAGGIDAVALSRGRRTVGKDVSQVRSAAGAMNFQPHHAFATIEVGLHRVLGHGGRVAGPAARAVELVRRLEQRRAAADAGVRPGRPCDPSTGPLKARSVPFSRAMRYSSGLS